MGPDTNLRAVAGLLGRSVASILIAAPDFTGRVAFLQMGYLRGKGRGSRNCELGSFSNNSGQTRDHEASTKHSSNGSDNGQPRLRDQLYEAPVEIRVLLGGSKMVVQHPVVFARKK